MKISMTRTRYNKLRIKVLKNLIMNEKDLLYFILSTSNARKVIVNRSIDDAITMNATIVSYRRLPEIFFKRLQIYKACGIVIKIKVRLPFYLIPVKIQEVILNEAIDT